MLVFLESFTSWKTNILFFHHRYSDKRISMELKKKIYIYLVFVQFPLKNTHKILFFHSRIILAFAWNPLNCHGYVLKDTQVPLVLCYAFFFVRNYWRVLGIQFYTAWLVIVSIATLCVFTHIHVHIPLSHSKLLDAPRTCDQEGHNLL